MCRGFVSSVFNADQYRRVKSNLCCIRYKYIYMRIFNFVCLLSFGQIWLEFSKLFLFWSIFRLLSINFHTCYFHIVNDQISTNLFHRFIYIFWLVEFLIMQSLWFCKYDIASINKKQNQVCCCLVLFSDLLNQCNTFNNSYANIKTVSKFI